MILEGKNPCLASRCSLAGDGDACDRKPRRFAIAIFGALRFDPWNSAACLKYICSHHKSWCCCLLSGAADEIVPPEQMNQLHAILKDQERKKQPKERVFGTDMPGSFVRTSRVKNVGHALESLEKTSIWVRTSMTPSRGRPLTPGGPVPKNFAQ